jgi:hypothetical protein
MTASIQEKTVFHADPEHEKLRYAVLAGLLFFALLSFFVVRLILQLVWDASPFILVCGFSLPIGLGIGWVFEKMLKQNWHSGSFIEVQLNGIRAVNQVSEDVYINWDGDMSLLKWTFQLSGYPRGGRERRLPSTHHCFAMQLRQDGVLVTIFSYLPSGQAHEQAGFVKLNPGEVYKTSTGSRLADTVRPELPSQVLMGENGRFWLAEKHRWHEGFELEPNDFVKLLRIVEENN